MENKNVKREVLDSIIKRLGIEGIQVDDLSYYDTPIFLSDDEDGNGLGLDSIDAIEVIIAIKEDFGVKIGDEDIKVLRTVSSIADFINKKKDVL